MLYVVDNPFISIYRTAKETLEVDEGNINSLCVILNPQMQIIVETELDKRQINLLISNKIAIFISDEYNESEFCNIVLAEKIEDGNRPHFH